ncbi:hypothetical protein QFC22_006402 [Naganishia vaughanmartiniae]|uniref:Uncharacterized protein n=1 Tax=Naganishia vaughanmartiniae TaxID=1424756 RepID=A0ACC2WKE1_9TREE|nr:hypothetical protein QFC22_006402 [Naganishia vaughanmartiniae]
MALSILTARRIASVLLIAFSIVVLGLSAHIESSIRSFGVSTGSYTFSCFVAAFTIFCEIAAAIRQWKKPSSILANGTTFVIPWALWLASSIAVTHSTSDDRSFCRNINNLTNDPELAGLDPEILKVAKKVLKQACSQIHASLAFSWMSFVLSTIILVGMFVLGIRERRKGNRNAEAWKMLVMQSNEHTASSNAVDPFADPVPYSRENVEAGGITRADDTK